MPLDHFSGSESNERRNDAPRKDSGYQAEKTQSKLTAIKQAEADDTWPPEMLDGMLDDELEALLEGDNEEGDMPEFGSLDALDGAIEDTDFDDLDALFDDEADTDDAETSREERLAALTDWIETNLPDCRPTDRAADICLEMEDQKRPFFVDYSAMEDPQIRNLLEVKLGRQQLSNSVSTKAKIAKASTTSFASNTEQLERQQQGIADVETLAKESQAEVTETQVKATETKETLMAETVARDEDQHEVKSVTDLRDRHQGLVTEHKGNQRAALEALRAEVDDNPDFAQKIDSIIATLDRIERSVPASDRPAVTKLLSSATLNLAGSGPMDVFGNFLTSIEASDEISEEAKTAIREAVLQEHMIHRGSEVKTAARQTRRDPETGEEVPVYTANNRREVRKGVSTYTETGDEVLVRLDLPGHPPLIRDVTGWSDDDVGLLTEAMGFSAALEQFGATAFVEDIYKIDFSLIGKSAFDRESLRSIRQSISAMVGTFEGYDGDIFDAESKIGLIRHQARLLSAEGTAYGTENSREATLSDARKLGIRNEDGVINFDVFKAFGAYAQETFLSGDASHADLHARLHEEFPQFAEAPQADSQLMAA